MKEHRMKMRTRYAVLVLMAVMLVLVAPGIEARRASCFDTLYYRLAEIGNEQAACLNSWQALIPNYCQGVASVQAAAAFVDYAACTDDPTNQ